MSVSISKAKRIALIRDSVEKVVRLLSGQSIDVIQAGNQCCVVWDQKDLKPKAVYLPVIPDDATDLFLNAVQGFLDHEVAHMLFTDVLAVAEANARKVVSLHNMVEDCFIEKKMQKEFAGSQANLDYMREIFVDRFTNKKLKELSSDAPTLKYWNILGICAMRAWSGQITFQQYMDENNHWEKIEEVTDKLGDLIKDFGTLESSWDALKLALKIKAKLYEKPPEKKKKPEPEEPEKEEEPDEEPEESEGSDEETEESEESENEESESEGESEPDEDSDESDGESDESEEGSESEEGEGAGESSESDEGDEVHESSESDLEDDGDESSGKDGDEPDDLDDGSEDGFGDDPDGDEKPLFNPDDDGGLPDYDDELSREISKMAEKEITGHSYVPYSRDWDFIAEAPIIENKRVDNTVRDISDEVDKHISVMQRELKRAFIANNKSRWETGHRSGRLNTSGLSRLATNDDRIFRRKEEIRTKEVAVSLVVDCSGSMCGTRIHTAAATAWALSQVLDSLKIDHEVIGFTTIGFDSHEHYGIKYPEKFKKVVDKFKEEKEEGKSSSYYGGLEEKYSRFEPIYMPVFKDWNESFSNDTKKKLASAASGLTSLKNNVDGESIMYAAKRLMTRPEPGKTMIVLSDGQPAFDYYGSVTPDKHLKQSVKALEKAGVNMVGIGIQTDCVRNYYSKNVQVKSLGDLPKTVMRELSKVILQK